MGYLALHPSEDNILFVSEDPSDGNTYTYLQVSFQLGLVAAEMTRR